MAIIPVLTHYYQQFDADHSRQVPAEAYGGWKSETLEIDTDRTAVVIMHAWEAGTPADYPGWFRAVEYLPRSAQILEQVFPPLLAAVRSSSLRLFHVAGGPHDYYSHHPGYGETRRILAAQTGSAPPSVGPPVAPAVPPAVPPGEGPSRSEVSPPATVYQRLTAFRRDHVFPGAHNLPDIDAGFAAMHDFPQPVRPRADEPIATTTEELVALCRHYHIDHLIYTGFAINWCLLLSPGGMAHTSRHGILCSAIKEAVTAVENKETAAEQLNKQTALWRVSIAFGFVYHLREFVAALQSEPKATIPTPGTGGPRSEDR